MTSSQSNFEQAAGKATTYGDENWLPRVDKNDLIDTPFIIYEAEFLTGDMGPYVALTILREDSKQYRLIDGSTGVYKQVERMVNGSVDKDTGEKIDPIKFPVLCAHGLRRSDYMHGKQPATTYYIAG